MGVPLASYSHYRIGGAAEYFCKANDPKKLRRAVEIAHERKLPMFVLGGGTNLLISDEGVKGMVIKPDIRFLKVRGTTVRVGAGTAVGDLLRYTVKKGLSGLEWAGGLPGTVGGAIWGNAGAFGGEIKDIMREVVSMRIAAPPFRMVRRGNAACRFGYRTSVFKEKSGQEVILEAVFRLRHGDPKKIQEEINEKIQYRRDRQPIDYPNIGSIFKNVDLRLIPKRLLPQFAQVIKKDPFPVVPAAYLIDRAGLKGVSVGGAMISPRHPNFIVNVLDARAADVKTLIRLVKVTIKEAFGILLEEEIIYV